jgi:hypothetical protein
MVYWKFLRAGTRSPFTGFDWQATEGRWVTAIDVHACHRGIHVCRQADLPYWLTEELWRIDLAEPVADVGRKVVASRARLLDRVEAWGAETARELAVACVGRAVQHAADELREFGLVQEAHQLEGQPLGRAPTIARVLLPSLTGRRIRPASKLCGYVIDAAEAVNVYPVATVAYIAARAADQRSGPPGADLYADERAWQADWLAEHLHLDTPT